MTFLNVLVNSEKLYLNALLTMILIDIAVLLQMHFQLQIF